MERIVKNKIRPLYAELQGYLTEAPAVKYNYDHIDTASVWPQYNQAISELINKTNIKKYGRFKITPLSSQTLEAFVRVLDYRQKLGGLIARLHAEYFFDEPAPFSGMPSTIIQQTQSQSVDIQMLLTIQSKIDEQLSKFPDGSPEKSFLQKLKTSLTGIKDVTQLIAQLISAAKSTGLTVEELTKIFS